ncbi:MAG TPA: hypothetical protein VIX89_15630, partial [Bryobacteraceae bacterium]
VRGAFGADYTGASRLRFSSLLQSRDRTISIADVLFYVNISASVLGVELLRMKLLKKTIQPRINADERR